MKRIVLLLVGWLGICTAVLGGVDVRSERLTVAEVWRIIQYVVFIRMGKDLSGLVRLTDLTGMTVCLF